MEEQERKRLFDKNKAEEAEERQLGDCWRAKKHLESLYIHVSLAKEWDMLHLSDMKTSLTRARANEDCMAYKRERQR